MCSNYEISIASRRSNLSSRGEVPGRPIDPATIRGFGVQLARSIQPASLRDGGDIPFRLVIAMPVMALNATTESIVPEIIENAARKLEESAIQRAKDSLNDQKVMAIQTASDQLFSEFAPRLLSSFELDQIFASPVVFATVRFGREGGTGRPAPTPPRGLEFEKEQSRLDMISDIRSIMRSPNATKIWLRSLLIDFAVAVSTNQILDQAGRVRLDSDAFRTFMASRLGALGFWKRIKTEAFQQPGGGFGLSKEVINIGIMQSVVFDQSPFRDRVGEFSFPMTALFYASIHAQLPESEKLSRMAFPAFFRSITLNAVTNQFTGWRLWQRLFANQDGQVAGSINSLDWWRVMLNSVVD